MKREQINESSVAQGDLVFIYHKTKPMKTGWWRKIREGSSDDRVVYYVLEKPMHKDYDYSDAIYQSHGVKGLCVMMDRTVKQGIGEKYEILADIRGVDCVNLTLSNYNLTSLKGAPNNSNIIYTDRFVELLSFYQPASKKASELELLAKKLI